MPYVCLLFCQLWLAQSPIDFEKQLLDGMRNGQHAAQLQSAQTKDPLETFNATVDALRLPNPPAPPSSATAVSTTRLAHKIPKAAQKAFEKASKLVKKNRYAQAAALFEKAVEIDPEFADAHNDLGAQYMALGRLAEAELQFRKAVDLDAAFAVARANLAASEYLRGDLVNAEKEAQRALSLAPSNRSSLQLLNLIRSKRQQWQGTIPSGLPLERR